MLDSTNTNATTFVSSEICTIIGHVFQPDKNRIKFYLTSQYNYTFTVWLPCENIETYNKKSNKWSQKQGWPNQDSDQLWKILFYGDTLKVVSMKRVYNFLGRSIIF